MMCFIIYNRRNSIYLFSGLARTIRNNFIALTINVSKIITRVHAYMYLPVFLLHVLCNKASKQN